MIDHQITVYPNGKSAGEITVQQWDNLSHRLIFTVPQQIIQNEGLSAKLRVLPDGAKAPYVYPCEIEGNKMTCTPTWEAWGWVGIAYVQLVIYAGNDAVWQSEQVPVNVKRSIDQVGAVTPEEAKTLIEQLQKLLDEAAGVIDFEVEAHAVEEGSPPTAERVVDPNTGKSTIKFGMPPGPEGPQGPAGKNFVIKGYYDTLDALILGVVDPEPGDAYGVGFTYPYDVYIFDGVTLEWKNNGTIQGPPGQKGDPGNAATIQIGTVTTGEPGSEAQAANSGTENDAVIDFVIPRGNPGPGVPAGGSVGQYLRKASDEDYSTEWADVVSGSNPNLLDNWYFANPINQRGQTEYTGSGYTIDRWKTTGASSTLAVEDGSVVFTNTATSNMFRQDVDAPEKYAGKTLTLSVEAEPVSIGANPRAYLRAERSNGTNVNAAGEILDSRGVSWCSLEIPEDVIVIYLGITCPGGTGVSSRVYCAKLEIGDKQTLARQDAEGNWVLNDPPPDYGTELAKCQRYLAPLSKSGWGRWRASAYSSQWLVFPVPVPVEMRIRPSLSGAIENLMVKTLDDRTTIAGFTFSVDGYGPGYVSILAKNQGNEMTDGQLCLAASNSNTVFANAEL